MIKELKYRNKEIENCPMCNRLSSLNTKLGIRLNKKQGFFPQFKKGIEISILKCIDCELIYPSPLPEKQGLEHLINDFTIEDDLQNYAESYYLSGTFVRELRFLKNHFNSSLQNVSALDIGFGRGAFLRVLKNNCKEIYGIEPVVDSYNFVIGSKDIVADKDKLYNVDFETADFDNNKFDFIFFEAFQHIDDPNKALAKALKWLKPEGLIYMEVAHSNWLISKIINAHYKFLLTKYVTNLSPLHKPFNMFEFSHKSFIKNGNLNNYKVLKHEIFVCNPYLKGWLGRILSQLMERTNTGMQLSIWIQKRN